MLPLETTINIPITPSFVLKSQHLKIGLRVLTSNMQTYIHMELSKQTFRSLAPVDEIEVTFLGQV